MARRGPQGPTRSGSASTACAMHSAYATTTRSGASSSRSSATTFTRIARSRRSSSSVEIGATGPKCTHRRDGDSEPLVTLHLLDPNSLDLRDDAQFTTLDRELERRV